MNWTSSIRARVLPLHELARPYSSWAEAQHALKRPAIEPLLTKLVSAHVTGGCGLAGEERLGVAQPDGVYWQLQNLSIHDGSLFPTSIAANPQLSVYGIVNRQARGLARRLTGREIARA